MSDTQTYRTVAVRWARNILAVAILLAGVAGYTWLMLAVIGWLT